MLHGQSIPWRGIRLTVMAAALICALTMVAFYAPVDGAMGPVQKLIYLHLPVAIGSFATAAMVFVASLAHMWTRKAKWNAVARAAGLATVCCSLVVLATGMIWAKSMWGMWWTWSPRLTFTLVMFVLYAIYIALQWLASRSPKWESRCSSYGCVAFLDVPLVYMSIRLLPDVHPTSIPMTSEMNQTLIPCFIFIALLCAEFIFAPLARPVDSGVKKPSVDTPVSPTMARPRVR